MLGDDIARALPELRAHAESMMRTPCVARPVVAVTSDDVGDDLIEYGPVVYSGLCRLRNRGGAATVDAQSADSTRVVDRIEWHIPHDAPEVRRGMVVFIEGVPRFRVLKPADGDDLTARRYPVERVS